MGQSLFFNLPVDFFGNFPKKKPSLIEKKNKKFQRYNSELPFWFVQKWWLLNQIKRKRETRFKNIKNNGELGDLKIFSKIKKIFINQLPNMPISYISRLLMDKKNETIVLQKQKGGIFHTIGGCCFRSLEKKQTLELIFFAIATQEQGKGFGKQLMSFLKDYHVSNKGRIVITCADNNAVNFFVKQGFSEIITNPSSLWAVYIRDYEETTLMECSLTCCFSYNHYPVQMTVKQFYFFSKFRNLFAFFPKIRKKIFLRLEKKKPYKKNYLLSLKISDSQEGKSFIHDLIAFLSEIKTNNFSKPFLEPVNTRLSGAKDYFHSIPNAVDMRSIEEKIRSQRAFYSYESFLSNIKLMAQNCRNYNSVGHSISENSYQLERNVKIWKLNHR